MGGAFAGDVQGSGECLLATACRTRDQHGHIGVGDPSRIAHVPQHLRIISRQVRQAHRCGGFSRSDVDDGARGLRSRGRRARCLRFGFDQAGVVAAAELVVAQFPHGAAPRHARGRQLF